MRLKYAASFETCYSFRLLFYAGSFYPIMGALRFFSSISVLQTVQITGYFNIVATCNVAIFFYFEKKTMFLTLQFLLTCYRMAYPNKYEIYRRVDEPSGQERYVLLEEFVEKPTPDEITNAFRPRKK